MNVSSKSKWKSVPIDPELMARGFSEGLLGIEELTDYQLIKVNKKKKPPVDVPDINNKLADSNSKSDKKIVSGQKRTLQNEHEANDSETPAKKKRKKKKKKIKKNNDSCPEMEEGTDKNDSKPPAEEQPDSNEQQTSTEVGELEGWKDMYIPKQVMQALKFLKYYQPTPIQRETLPAAINGHADIVGAAETGSGKTLSFAIPMVHGILEDFEKESLVKTEDESCEETSEKTCLTDSMLGSGEYFQFYEKNNSIFIFTIFYKSFHQSLTTSQRQKEFTTECITNWKVSSQIKETKIIILIFLWEHSVFSVNECYLLCRDFCPLSLSVTLFLALFVNFTKKFLILSRYE